MKIQRSRTERFYTFLIKNKFVKEWQDKGKVGEASRGDKLWESDLDIYGRN